MNWEKEKGERNFSNLYFICLSAFMDFYLCEVEVFGVLVLSFLYFDNRHRKKVQYKQCNDVVMVKLGPTKGCLSGLMLYMKVKVFGLLVEWYVGVLVQNILEIELTFIFDTKMLVLH